MNSPSPLVPQGAIPPKTTSRSARVLWIGLMVVGLHVGGLSLVLLQGCGKNSTGNLASADTNAPVSSAYPAIDTNPPPNMFSSATNAAPSIAAAPTNVPGFAPAPTFAASGDVSQNLAGIATDPGITAQPTEPSAPAGPEKDYKIQPRDTLSGISTRNRITLGALMTANPNLDPMKLKIGQTIKIPMPPATAPAMAGTDSTPPTSGAGVAPSGAAGTYKVKPGDNLSKIARAHGITVNQLRAANNMRTTQVQAGKTLKIPARTQRTAAAAAGTDAH